jgi:dolichol kinase
MFACTFLVMVVALLYYQIPFSYQIILVLFVIAWVAALAEGITPLGLDNLSVPFICAALFWLLVVM